MNINCFSSPGTYVRSRLVMAWKALEFGRHGALLGLTLWLWWFGHRDYFEDGRSAWSSGCLTARKCCWGPTMLPGRQIRHQAMASVADKR